MSSVLTLQPRIDLLVSNRGALAAAIAQPLPPVLVVSIAYTTATDATVLETGLLEFDPLPGGESRTESVELLSPPSQYTAVQATIDWCDAPELRRDGCVIPEADETNNTSPLFSAAAP